jgi:hypothetical protein
MREWARVTSLAEHDGLLFATVASCTSSVIDAPADVRGSVHAMRAGWVATTALPLEQGRQHVAAIRSGPRLSIFIDGREAASVDGPPMPLPAKPAPLRIATAGNGYVRGSITGLAFFSHALTAREIAELADAPTS